MVIFIIIFIIFSLNCFFDINKIYNLLISDFVIENVGYDGNMDIFVIWNIVVRNVINVFVVFSGIVMK